MNRKSLRKFSAALIAVLSFSIFAAAQNSDSPAAFSNVKIGNFGQMDERFYRGAQPVESDYQALKDLGITTVIDLRNDPMEYEKGAVEALGMTYVNIPMSGWKTPQQKDVDDFLALVNSADTGKFFVHCKAGIHRTGVVGAAYRYTNYGWNYDQVYKEMKDYNYSNGLVHGKLGSFVKKWGGRLADEKSRAGSPARAAVVPAAQGVNQ
ncbi:MAG: tyrosine-protein phosphatase [Acidobacteriota bacterium]